MKRINLLLLVLFLCSYNTFSQELNCFVSINTSNLQGTDKEKFNTLRESISDFMNARTWSNNVFEVHERIECNVQINLTKENSADDYDATLNIQARRPIYGSTYNTVMLNTIDENVRFKYTEFDPLEFSETSHLNNLTSTLAYYIYIILGLDYDSFSANGGEQFFLKAEKIVTNAQSSADIGWKAFEDRGRKNRYWLVNNILDEGYSPLREFNYQYHRLGLDLFDKSVEQGRLVIKETIIDLEKFHSSKPDPFMYFFQVMIDSKADEIVQIFSEANQADKSRIEEIMSKIDPANSRKYAPLKE